MFGLIILVIIGLAFAARLFTRPFYGFYHSRIHPFIPFSSFGGWEMGCPRGPMFR